MMFTNKKEVRPIDNLMYWSMVMPPANQKYEIFKEYTNNNEYSFTNTTKDDVSDDYLSDDRYLQSKNIATCAVVKYIREHSSQFTGDRNQRVYADSDDSDFGFSPDIPIGVQDKVEDYINIALKTRYTFSETILRCPCAQFNEYFYTIHKIQMPDEWCSSKKKYYNSLSNLLEHLKKESVDCKWHDIYYIFYKTFREEEEKKKR